MKWVWKKIKSIIRFHLKSLSELITAIGVSVFFALVLYFMVYMGTGVFDPKLFFIFIGVLVGLGYFLFIIVKFISYIWSTPYVQIKLLLNKSITRKIPIGILFLVLTISALGYDYTVYDKESLMQFLTLTWTIFGFNITIFIFSYAFITKGLENKKANASSDAGSSYAKMNYNDEIHSRYGTFYYIFLNAIILIFATTSVLMLTKDNDISKLTFVINLVAFTLSTNTLMFVLSDVLIEIRNKKLELAFEETLVKKEREELIDIIKKTKILTDLHKSTETITELVTNDEVLKFHRKLGDNQIPYFKDEKSLLKFVTLFKQYDNQYKEYYNLFLTMQEKLRDFKGENFEALIEVLTIQKQIKTSYKTFKKTAKKLNHFKFRKKDIPPPD